MISATMGLWMIAAAATVVTMIAVAIALIVSKYGKQEQNEQP